LRIGDVHIHDARGESRAHQRGGEIAHVQRNFKIGNVKPLSIRDHGRGNKNGIGGHCILPNAKILKKYFKSRALDFILEYNLGKKVANL